MKYRSTVKSSLDCAFIPYKRNINEHRRALLAAMFWQEHNAISSPNSSKHDFQTLFSVIYHTKNIQSNTTRGKSWTLHTQRTKKYYVMLAGCKAIVLLTLFEETITWICWREQFHRNERKWTVLSCYKRQQFQLYWQLLSRCKATSETSHSYREQRSPGYKPKIFNFNVVISHSRLV